MKPGFLGYDLAWTVIETNQILERDIDKSD